MSRSNPEITWGASGVRAPTGLVRFAVRATPPQAWPGEDPVVEVYQANVSTACEVRPPPYRARKHNQLPPVPCTWSYRAGTRPVSMRCCCGHLLEERRPPVCWSEGRLGLSGPPAADCLLCYREAGPRADPRGAFLLRATAQAARTRALKPLSARVSVDFFLLQPPLPPMPL